MNYLPLSNGNGSIKKKKWKRPYIADKKLIPRLQEHLEKNKGKQYLNLTVIATQLQKQYRDYSRNAPAPFLQQVEKAYDVITHDVGPPDGWGVSDVDCDSSSDVEVVSELNQDVESVVSSKLLSLYQNPSSPQLLQRTVHQNPTSPQNQTTKKSVSDYTTTDADTPAKQDSKKRKKVEPDLEPAKKKKRKFEVTPIESTVTFSNVGGNQKSLVEICKLMIHLRHPEVYKVLGVKPPRGFLLHGPPGCGKTLVANAVAGELKLPLLSVCGPELVSGISGESEEKIRDIFRQAASLAPCILFMDEIDAIIQKRENASKDMERRIIAQMLVSLDELATTESGSAVMVIGATNKPESLDPGLRRAGRFDREIALGIPDEATRVHILEVLCRDIRFESDVEFKWIARHSPGYVGADLQALTREASMIAINRVFRRIEEEALKVNEEKVDSEKVCEERTEELASKDATDMDTEEQNGANSQITQCSQRTTRKACSTSDLPMLLEWLKEAGRNPLTEDQLASVFVTRDDISEALQTVQPSAQREGFATVPDVTWDDVGALEKVREELHISILVPIQHPEQCAQLGISSSAGILLYGPPGCGKTLLAKAVANEAQVNFISVKGPELLNMYVGESERAVRACFQRARSSAPCVIFFDELDALCPKRTDIGDSGASSRVVNQLLTEMDGLNSRQGVTIMAATNRPDILDPAVMRPGRMDKRLFVGLPQDTDRADILKAITKNGTRPLLDNSTDLVSLSTDSRCEGFTGADLQALVREASTAALREYITTNRELEGDHVITVNSKHFNTAFSNVKPSVSVKDRAKYEGMRNEYSNQQH